MNEILENNKTKSFLVLDARSADRFFGRVPEPMLNLQGHIPGSFNLPIGEIIKDGSYLEPKLLTQAYVKSGIDLEKPVVTTCGSSVTAAVLSLGLEIINLKSAVYDGSWSEYGCQNLNNPVTIE